MFRKHFRFRRMLLGLAFTALAVPATAFGAPLTFVDGGPMPVSVPQVKNVQIRSEHSRSVSTITPLQADGLRYTAMAQRYKELQAAQAISERSNGVKGPDPSLVPQVVVSTSDSFSWKDAGIGASSVFAAVLLLGCAIAVTRRNQHSGLTRA